MPVPIGRSATADRITKTPAIKSAPAPSAATLPAPLRTAPATPAPAAAPAAQPSRSAAPPPIQGLIPASRRVRQNLDKPRGVRRVDDWRVFNGIIWVLRSGAPWQGRIETRRATVFRYFVDAGALRFLRKRGKRAENFIFSVPL